MKNSKTFKEQIEILDNRKFGISNKNNDKLKLFLQNNNYYRMTGYLYKYKLEHSEDFTDEIWDDKFFEIYKFDEFLRSHVNRLMGIIELSFKTYIAYTIAINYGPTGYLDPNNFYNKKEHSEFINIIKGMLNQSKNKQRIKHNTKIDGDNIAIWVLVGILSFSNIAKLYSNMLIVDQKEISNTYLRSPINIKILSKWLNNFALLRNDCAHHERLYYEELRNIDIKTNIVKSNFKKRNNTLFSYLLCACHLIYDKEIWVEFVEILDLEIDKYSLIDLGKIGFPPNWKDILLNEF